MNRHPVVHVVLSRFAWRLFTKISQQNEASFASHFHTFEFPINSLFSSSRASNRAKLQNVHCETPPWRTARTEPEENEAQLWNQGNTRRPSLNGNGENRRRTEAISSIPRVSEETLRILSFGGGLLIFIREAASRIIKRGSRDKKFQRCFAISFRRRILIPFCRGRFRDPLSRFNPPRSNVLFPSDFTAAVGRRAWYGNWQSQQDDIVDPLRRESP